MPDDPKKKKGIWTEGESRIWDRWYWAWCVTSGALFFATIISTSFAVPFVVVFLLGADLLTDFDRWR